LRSLRLGVEIVVMSVAGHNGLLQN
jgi:hypothetical protein